MDRLKDNYCTLNDLELHEKKVSGELNYLKEQYLQSNYLDFYKLYKSDNIANAFYRMCEIIPINKSEDDFVYFFDYIFALDYIRGYRYGNITPNYKIILENGISSLFYVEEDSRFCKDYNRILQGLIVLSKRIYNQTDSIQKEWFRRIINEPAEHFDEALQRILFVNQVLWQTDHFLVGLGSLDDLLIKYYEKDIKSGYMLKNQLKEKLKKFLLQIHNYYWFKSGMLMGDTGQIIVLGKTDELNNYKYNELTIMLIELIKELQLPDPKILLRVNENTPNEVLSLALDTIGTGVGSPILSNDKVVIPKLIKFGINKLDALDYGVSACWEPLISGKSVSLNNMTTLNFMRPLENLFRREKLSNVKSFNDLVEKYLIYLKRNLNAVKRVVKSADFQYDPILSVFIENCRERKKDVSQGGADYFDAGITSVALGNVVNSLLIIKELIYEKKLYSLTDVKKIVLTDYKNYEDLEKLLKDKKSKYGTMDTECIELTKKILYYVTENTKDFRTEYGGKLKYGLSAPTYIDAAKTAFASIDGRRYGDPFIVHISNETADNYMEILQFASSLDYGDNRFNGNVIDIMVNPYFIKHYKNKLIEMLKVGIDLGFFQLQMNVVSSEILIRAKDMPEMYPNLIVRVWGFSAYFNDLPIEYKNLLIKRAIQNERYMS